MNARALVDRLLEADVDDEIDPERFIRSTADKESWLVPHPWVAILRPLGFNLQPNEYKNSAGDQEKYWSMEKTVQLASGENLQLVVSGYTAESLVGMAGLSIYNDKGSTVAGSRPIALAELKRVMRDILRRLEHCTVDYYIPDYSDQGLVMISVEKALGSHEYWRAHRREKKLSKGH